LPEALAPARREGFELAGAVMAVGAGGGLLIAAGAAPAHAATIPAPPPGAHVITITAHSASGIGPKDILPCAVPGPASSSQVKPASCGAPPTISCAIFANPPTASPGKPVLLSADTVCTQPVSRISMTQTAFFPGGSTGNGDLVDNWGTALTQNLVACTPGGYQVSAMAFITFPAGYVISGGANPIHQASAVVNFSASQCGTSGGGGGGGGRGGCVVRAPSMVTQPAARQPNLISCQ
jgi:hypothetical protein